jgi:hypothetical protein
LIFSTKSETAGVSGAAALRGGGYFELLPFIIFWGLAHLYAFCKDGLRGWTSQVFFADPGKLAPCLNIPGDIAERRNCISSLAVVRRDKDENPGVGSMSPHLYKERKGGLAMGVIGYLRPSTR